MIAADPTSAMSSEDSTVCDEEDEDATTVVLGKGCGAVDVDSTADSAGVGLAGESAAAAAGGSSLAPDIAGVTRCDDAPPPLAHALVVVRRLFLRLCVWLLARRPVRVWAL